MRHPGVTGVGKFIAKRTSQAASLGELQSALRDVMVKGTTRADLEDIWESVLDMAKGQNQWAIQVVFERILGKAAVGQAATIADSAVSDEMTRRIDAMTDQELEAAAALAMKIHGDQAALTHQTEGDALVIDGSFEPGPGPRDEGAVRVFREVEEPGRDEEEG